MFCCCVYLNDDFSIDNLATDYNQVSGAWTVSTGKLRTTASGLILANATSDSNYHSVNANIVMNTNGDIVKVLAGYLDPSNHLFAELQQKATRVEGRLYKRVGGVNTQIGPTRFINPAIGIGVFPGGAFSVQICTGPDVTAAYFGGIQRVELDGDLPPGPYAGFEAVSVASGVSFGDYILTRHRSQSGACPACGDCLACIDDNGPAEMQLEAPFDIVGGSCGSACANASGTFIGTKFAAAGPGQFGCNWLASVTPGPCGAGGGWNIDALTPVSPNWDGGPSPGTYRLRASLGQLLPTVVNIIYEKDFGANRMDCLNFSTESLPWVGEPGSVGCTSSTHAPVIVSRV